MEILQLETLPGYDGGSVAVLLNRALRDAYIDLDDRPGLKKNRTITLKIDIKPRDVEGNDLETVECSMAVKLALPNREARVNILANDRKSSGLGFETDTRRAKHLKGQTKIPYEESDS